MDRSPPKRALRDGPKIENGMVSGEIGSVRNPRRTVKFRRQSLCRGRRFFAEIEVLRRLLVLVDTADTRVAGLAVALGISHRFGEPHGG